MRVSKWGNSLAVRLPAAFVESLQLKEGDEISMALGENRHVQVERVPSREELINRLDKYRGRLPADFKFDREEANAR